MTLLNRRFMFVLFCFCFVLGVGVGGACEAPVVPESGKDEKAKEKASDASVEPQPGERLAPPDARAEVVLPETKNPDPLPPEPGQEPTPDVPTPDVPTPDVPVPETPTPERQAPEPTPERPNPPDVPVGNDDFTKVGPLQTKELPQISIQVPASTGCQGGFCTVKLFITLPDGAGSGARKAPYPLAVLSNGFLLGASYYKSYATRLASWGYVVVRWDTNQESPFSNIKHKTLGEIVKEIINWADAQSKSATGALKSTLTVTSVLALGHSRGGKAAALAAQVDGRIKGLFLIDPVDAAPPGQTAVSAVQGMAKTTAPIAVMGADKGGSGFQPCAPKTDNYAKFYDAAKTKAWELLLTETGHMQFLDTQSGCLPCLACSKGTALDATVRQITQSAMVAWAESTIRGRDISAFLSGAWLQGWLTKKALAARNK